MNKLLITNIQRMCFHDGPGIRTTVFLKGCNLHCPWCSNPENISPYFEEYILDGRKGIYGREYTADDLIKEIMKDRIFWKDDGGVTFSGGEPLLQANGLDAVMQILKNENIHLAVESAVQLPCETWKHIAKYIDLYIIDLKILTDKECREITGGDPGILRDNLEYIRNTGKDLIFRVPCNKEFTLKKSNIIKLKELLDEYTDVPVEIFATHNFGRKKYESLGRDCPQWQDITKNELVTVAGLLRDRGELVKVLQF